MKILNFEENNTKVTFNNLNMLQSGKKNETSKGILTKKLRLG